jgi:HD-GYP domain-containing protein (c-di-GMP phosphodiesterase class II)
MSQTHRPLSRVPRAIIPLVEHLVGLLVACRLHDPGNPKVAAAAVQVRDALHALRSETGEAAFALLLHGESLVFQGNVPVPQNLAVARLVETLRRWRAGGMQIHSQAPEREVEAFLRALLKQPDGVIADANGVNHALSQLGVTAVRLVPGAHASPATPAAPAPAAPAANPVRTSAGTAVRDGVEEVFGAIAAGHALDLPRIQRCTESLLLALDAATTGQDGIDLAQQSRDDPLLVMHSLRTAGLAMLAARAMTRDQDLVVRLGVAAMLHDVGKLRLPLHLIQMEGESSEDHDPTLQQHPALGAELLLLQGGVDALCIEVVFGHHRTSDGNGQPETPHDHRPSRFTQIVRVVDLFESLTARRGGRAPLTPTLAWRTLCTRDDLVDRTVLRRVIEAVGAWPQGATVRLSSGEVARVVKATRDPFAPIVRVLIAGSTGSPPGSLLDLSRVRGSGVSIAGSAS